MPAKRKRADDAAPRATRASSRLQTSTSTSTADADEHSATSGTAATTKATKNSGAGVAATEPAAKKARKATTKAPAAKKATGQTKQAAASPNVTLSAGNGTTTVTSKLPPRTPESYSEAQARDLFKAYEDKDAPGEIGPEGFETLCSDLDVSLEGALPLILAWQLHATEMGKFKESQWMQGTRELRISSLQTMSHMLRELEDLLLLDKPPIQRSSGSTTSKKKAAPVSAPLDDPYDRQKYRRYADDRNKAFGELYAFCFALAKSSTGRNIDMETASAFWSVLIAPKYPTIQDIVEFINEKGSYKGVNKDLWNMVLEFCRTVQPDLSNYEADGAWPTFIDDFVAWKKSKTSSGSDSTKEAA